MGQAKQRGTYEERVAQAQARRQLRKDLQTLTNADYKGAGVLISALAAIASGKVPIERGKA